MYKTTAYSIFSKYFCVNNCDKVEIFLCLNRDVLQVANICVVFDTWCGLAIMSLNKKHLNYFQL